MDGKLLARIGAAVLVGLAIAMTLVQLREEREPREGPVVAIRMSEGDPLPRRLQACSQMGDLALSSRDCQAAWAEKRRRFFGVGDPDTYRRLDEQSGAIAGSPASSGER